MNAFLLSIGDELASGLTVNTNSAWLAQRLGTFGIRTLAHVTVGDDVQGIATAIRAACEYLEGRIDPGDVGGGGKAAVLLISGGLGPTADDVTRQALADALNQQLVEDPDAMLQIERFFKSIGRPMAPSNRLQALRPQEASILENPAGTAPGLRARKDNVEIFVLPGVPREMRAMFTRSVVPALEEQRADQAADPVVTLFGKINTFGLGESNLGEKIKDLMARTPGVQSPGALTPEANSPAPQTQGFQSLGLQSSGPPSPPPVTTVVGTTVHEGIVSVRLYATGPRTQAQSALDQLRQVLHQRLGPLIFSEDDVPLEAVVAELLKQTHHTIATAESCTGGMLAAMLTNTPGSSAYFLRGWVTYANTAKHDELAVPDDLLAAHGAVSEPVARAMALAAKRIADTDFALATTGIAGPDGGTPEKPVGTVWIALATPHPTPPNTPAGTLARKFHFPGNRHQVRLRTAQMALALLRWRLMNVPAPI